MNKKCIVATLADKYFFNNSEVKVLYIEDYIQFASVSDARKLTDNIFLHNPDFIEEHDYEGYKITWSWYSDIFQFCIKYLEIESLVRSISKLNVEYLEISNIPPQYRKILEFYFFDKNIVINYPKSRILSGIKQVLFNAIMLSFSVISLLFFILRPSKNIGTYTGDFIYKDTKSDFRLNNLYEKYTESGTRYIEFIRSTSIKNFFVNIYKRRRFAIYYTSIVYFTDLLTPKKTYRKKPQNFYQSVLYRNHHDNIVLNRSIFIIKIILKSLNVDKFVLISFSSRSAHLSIAAKSLGIKTIGIMHGLQQKEYAVYEFMESYEEKKKVGCDVYGVWSPCYLDYFRKYCKIVSSENIHYSGLLRPVNYPDKTDEFSRVSNSKIKILLISEPLVSIFEIIPYLDELLKHQDIDVSIKIRPMYKDSFYESLKVEYPKSKQLKVVTGKINDASSDYDIFIGSNSTAVIEASLFGKLSVLVDTKKWGDYFELDNFMPEARLIVNSPELLYETVKYRINNEKSLKTVENIRYHFFGDGKDGAQWVIDQL